ncbi:hypothetical protein HCG51_33925 (plasmid) [Tolypothrix sp. PCC 7910]|uniref:hypothetical protein n=1 Tax=Tolypothrix sp. PCC 7910 TaxID=2099387 RepID=UPI0014279A73|nr:hypothetical protein [Tolypothrix sp. PCC 7910]QIR41710.1 hypothetical protein HCG51_33925 [Tolypothrix sp. PCC 7910]
MKKFQLIKSGIIATSAIGALTAPLSAFAIPYQGATVYKAMDGSNQVVVFSATPGSRISVNLGSSPRPVARLAGSCGEVRISPPASGDFTGLQVDGTAIDASTLLTQTLPSCVSGAFSETRNTNFKTPTGQVVVVNKTPGSAVSVSLPSAVTRSVTVGACGFGVLRASSGQTLPTSFLVNTTSYTIASLPNSVNVPYCRTINGTPYGYVPTSWLP